VSSSSTNEAVWKAQPRQRVALKSDAFELFYGGAAGGGKSDYLLIDFLNGIEHGSAHRGVLFRRTYPELQELIRRSYEIYPRLGHGGAQFSKSDKIWTFPGGATLRFAQMESDADVHKYQGHQHTWQGWDELTNWPTDYPYVYMLSRLRSAEGIKVRVRAAGNPGGAGHAWVKARFIDGKEPERLYIDEDHGQTKVFIPAKLSDNAILMEADPGYADRLKMLPPHLQRAYLEGDWDIFSGQAFDEWRYDRHVIKPFKLEPHWVRFASMDWGYQKPFSIGWWAITGDGRFIRYREWYGCEATERNKGLKMAAETVARQSFEMSAGEGVDQMVADPAVWSKIDDTPSIAEIFADAGWKMERANNDRRSGLQRMHDLMKTNGHDGLPQLLVFATCTAFIRTIPLMTIDSKKMEDVDTTGEDHVYDEARYAAMSTQSRRAQDTYHSSMKAQSVVEEYAPV
jgi:hypothetical protein